MTQPPARDLIRELVPGFADLRDKLGMRTVSSEYTAMHWVVRLEGASFQLMIGRDRADDWFYIRPQNSSRNWGIATILHELGLWDNLRERPDDRKLAQVFEQNLTAVLRHIVAKEG